MRASQRHRAFTDAKIDLAAMIDVVFLLLVFFVLAVKPVDVLAKLDVSRPAATPDDEIRLELLQIDVLPERYAVNGRMLDETALAESLARWGRHTPRSTVKIVCDSASTHSRLVKALDACEAAGLKNLALFSR